MSVKNSKTINFIRKNVYYFAFIICLAVLSVITIALVVNYNKPNNGGTTIEKPNEDNNQNDNNGNLENKPSVDDNQNENNGNENEENNKEDEQKPVVSVIVFDMPVNGTIIKEYVAAGVVYNQTLGVYTGHKAIDFAAEEGALVSACYDGVIESITSGKLEGTTLTIDHGNGLKTVYNSIEVDENISVGNRISKGDTIGTVSTNNRKEFKDGAHLHFEVLENGVKINPEKYLLIEEK